MRYYRYGSDYGPKEFANYEAVVSYLRTVGPRYGLVDESYLTYENSSGKRLVSIYRNSKSQFTLACKDQLFHIQKFGDGDDTALEPVWEVKLDRGNLSSLSIGRMSFDGVLAVAGLLKGHIYNRG